MAASVSSTRSPAAPIALRPAAGHSRSAPLRQAVSVVLLLALWQALSGWFADATVVPSPGAVVSRAGELVASGGLLRDAAATLGRVVIGYVVGAVLGVACGLLIGWFGWMERLLGPSLNFVRSIPPIAWVPFSIIVFGIGEGSKYAIIVYLVFIVLALSAAAGVRETPRIRVRAAEALWLRRTAAENRIRRRALRAFCLDGAFAGNDLGF